MPDDKPIPEPASPLRNHAVVVGAEHGDKAFFVEQAVGDYIRRLETFINHPEESKLLERYKDDKYQRFAKSPLHAFPALVEVLRKVEWVQEWEEDHDFWVCPCCGNMKPKHHPVGCALAAALKMAEGK